VSPDLFRRWWKQPTGPAPRSAASPHRHDQATCSQDAKGRREGTVLHTLDRDALWRSRPQVFAASTSGRHMSGAAGRLQGTDDSSLVERLGMSVTVVAGRGPT
jgi:2-C-methyl-D-erythritol 4-phosphate cytidylyltransferase